MEWISVKDRLPTFFGIYLIFCDKHNPKIYCDGFGGVSHDYTGFAHDLLCDDKVTHWMPLPESPDHFVGMHDMGQ